MSLDVHHLAEVVTILSLPVQLLAWYVKPSEVRELFRMRMTYWVHRFDGVRGDRRRASGKKGGQRSKG